jgi:sugar phosphate isomerase/epimerase
LFFSGISDEAGSSIEAQIAAHQELGWEYLEIRGVAGANIGGMDEFQFERLHDALLEAKMGVSCFASAVANWARPITADPRQDYDELKRSAPRMHRLHTPFIRIMSYPNDTDHPLSERAWRIEAIRRVKEFARIAEDNGIVLVHENCSGWGGVSYENNQILIGEVDSPALKVVFDTGNPVTYGQDAWEYYHAVREAIVYVHIKDAKTNPDGSHTYTFCGEGDGYVPEIVADLLKTGYTGGFSIEPHLGAVIHTGEVKSDEASRYATYVEYGQRLMKIVKEAAVKVG